MKKTTPLAAIAMLATACLPITACAGDQPTPSEVKALTAKVADWQIETFDQHGEYRALPTNRKRWQNRKNYHDLTWHMAALYVGFNEFRQVADQPEKYADFLKMIGERNGWRLHHRPYHADDQAVGQVWLSLYQDYDDPAMREPTRQHFDWILANPKTGSLEYSGYGSKNKTDWLNRWGWCDALFMAPPVWARLAKITGEDRYLEFMDQEYHATYDLLWDEKEHFFYRDTSFFDQREDNGAKIFWSRGNGWVFGGLALMIPDLPQDWAGRQFYVDLYQEMAEALGKSQRPDGTWSMGLLGSLESYSSKETTGTSFFAFGLAWGINNGLLDRAIYEPIVLEAWQALEACVTPEGMLGFVQPVGAAPGETIANKTEVYAIGAFLAAGAEVYKLVGGSAATTSASTKANVAHTFARFVPERKDDFAWENDKIAFRTYGPALRDSAESSGIDAWLKRVDYPIIDKWYRQAEAGKSYHKDHGEGLDNYHVGSSAGVGGTGIWLDGQRQPLNTFTEHEVLEVSPERSRFKLSYQREIGGVTYAEEKTITIERGQHLFRVDSVFFKDGELAAKLPICVGLTTHDGQADTFFDREAGWIATWESLGDSELGTGARMNPKSVESIKVVDSHKKDTSHIFLIGRTDAAGRLSYEAGYGWKKAGEITTRQAWTRYLAKTYSDRTYVNETPPSSLSAPHKFTVFLENGGWCWFQDPRAIVHDGKLFIAGVQGNGSGAAKVGIYDLQTEQSLGTAIMQDNFDRDDHNAPALHLRPDGSVLAVYARHNREPYFYARNSDPQDPLSWNQKRKFEMSERVTYANLFAMKREGKLYNFFRGIDFNPTFVTSTDGGETWNNETHFIASEANGRHRPYTRYAGNGVDTVYISFTDGHPRRIGNNLYYAEFRDGKFWNADGSLIKDLKADGPLRPSEAEVIYQGSGAVRRASSGKDDTSVANSAWTSSMAVDAEVHPHIAYSVHLSNNDHRFRVATWDGQKWHDREVAFAGTQLYANESSYTGLITLDPVDPAYVVIATDVNPAKGDRPGDHEIYRAHIGLGDAREKPHSSRPGIHWKAITRNTRGSVQNIRPVIVRHGDRRIVLWNRGYYNSYTDYQLDTVGFVESLKMLSSDDRT